MPVNPFSSILLGLVRRRGQCTAVCCFIYVSARMVHLFVCIFILFFHGCWGVSTCWTRISWLNRVKAKGERKREGKGQRRMGSMNERIVTSEASIVVVELHLLSLYSSPIIILSCLILGGQPPPPPHQQRHLKRDGHYCRSIARNQLYSSRRIESSAPPLLRLLIQG